MTPATSQELARARALLRSEITERDFQRDIVDFAHLKHWRTYHTLDSRGSSPGWPDLVLCRPPRLVVLELKTETGRVSPEQRSWIDDLGACGIDAQIVRPCDWDEIEELLR